MMPKFDHGQRIAIAVLIIIFATLAGLVSCALYGERDIAPSQLRTELAILPEPLRIRTLDYLRSSHESLFDSYTPGDRLTWNRLRTAKAAARQAIKADLEELKQTRVRAEREALLNAIAVNLTGDGVPR
jgi:hypothetical protein